MGDVRRTMNIAQFSLTRLLLHDLMILVILLSSLVLPSTTPLQFDFPDFKNFDNGTREVFLQGDATVDKKAGHIQLTYDRSGGNKRSSIGRAFIGPMRLQTTANFTTEFSFQIRPDSAPGTTVMGDGLAFFIAPYPSLIPNQSAGENLGLATQDFQTNWTEFRTSGNSSFVAVEFDSYRNSYFDPSDSHVGIDINSLKSVDSKDVAPKLGNMSSAAMARITYDSNTNNFSVFLNYSPTYTFSDGPILSRTINLSTILPESVSVGLSASTGVDYGLHSVHSWSFNSTDLLDTGAGAAGEMNNKNSNENKRTGLVIGVSVGGGIIFVFVVAGMVCFLLRNKINIAKGGSEGRGSGCGGKDDHHDTDDEVFVEIEGETTGPRKFSYEELVTATGNFREEAKLGEGGFGSVYRGFLRDPDSPVAIKRVKKGSKQGKKEYVAEVKIISRLRHRNLVQLVGWCHDHNDLLLVYELMPNGSLDTHLFSPSSEIYSSLLSWPIRYKIAQGLASALLYLHEECEQCVVHRDIKSSNVMLDSDFSAKLGDFGLARLAKHGFGLQTTALAGTMGYMAPECFHMGKGSKESDVYSFGIVSLEVACGRRCVESMVEEGRVRLVSWVWEMYGEGRLLEVVDPRLGREYDEEQMERLLVVGLWCAFPDRGRRPSIMQAINVLNLAAALPSLPSKMPSMYFSGAPDMELQPIIESSSSLSLISMTSAPSHTIASETFSSDPSSQTNFSSSASLLRRSDKRADA